MSKEEIKKLLINNSREWRKEIAQDVAVIYVDDFIEELLSKLHQPTVIKSVCVHVRGSIVMKDDIAYAECRNCGELY